MRNFLQRFSVWLSLISVFVIYFVTIGKSVLPNGDSGELIGTAFFGGIAHPPGYPLYNIIGHLFLKLPISGEPAFRLNLLSAIFHVIALYFFYKTCLLLSKSNIFLSIISTLILAFSYSFWLYSLVAEVFSLQDLFLCALLFLLFKLVMNKEVKVIKKTTTIWSFLFGLGMSNNHIIVLLLPVFLYVLLLKSRQMTIFSSIREAILFSCKLLLLFIVGLFPYLFFIFAAKNINPVSWLFPITLKDFLQLFFRLDYGGPLNYSDFSFVNFAPKIALTNLLNLFNSLISDLWFFSCFVLAGVIFLIIDFKNLISKVLLFLLGVNLLLIALFRYEISYYSFSVLERIFLSIDIIFIIVAVRSIFVFSNILKKNLYKYLFYSIIFIILCFEFIINLKKANQSQNFICRDYYQDVVRTIPSNSIVLVNGDMQSFCLYYYLFVLKTDMSKKIIYIFPPYFLNSNRGQYLEKFMNFDTSSFKSYDDVVKMNYKTKAIFLIKANPTDEYEYVPLGIFTKIIVGNKDIDWALLYFENKKWWQKSQLFKHYNNANFLNLGNKAMKEYYCQEYLKLSVFFQQHKQNNYSKLSFKDFTKFCFFSDFSQVKVLSPE